MAVDPDFAFVHPFSYRGLVVVRNLDRYLDQVQFVADEDDIPRSEMLEQFGPWQASGFAVDFEAQFGFGLFSDVVGFGLHDVGLILWA